MGLRRLALFASGGGSNFEAILRGWQEGIHPLEPVALVADRRAPVLDKARDAGIEARFFGKSCWSQEAPGAPELLHWLQELHVDAVALAGFLRKVPPLLVEAYRGRMVNIHPALLPSFGGAGMYGHFVHEAVWKAGCRVSGATVHLVDEVYDRGPILLQEAVALQAEDGPEAIAARVLEAEHRVYSQALALLAGGVIIQEGRVIPCPESR
jgi:phosphoribosylglycinamide formyltransferase-1